MTDMWVTSSSIRKEIARQSVGMDLACFLCVSCANYRGGCGCEKGVFIAFVGANMNGCRFFEKGKKYPHCEMVVR